MKIDNIQKNSKCRGCRERDETISHIVSECNKLAQKEYKTRHDWVGKVITENCARNLILTIPPNGTNKNLLKKMISIKLSGILKYKEIT